MTDPRIPVLDRWLQQVDELVSMLEGESPADHWTGAWKKSEESFEEFRALHLAADGTELPDAVRTRMEEGLRRNAIATSLLARLREDWCQALEETRTTRNKVRDLQRARSGFESGYSCDVSG